MTAFRFRRIRPTEPDWLNRDAGTLHARRRSDGKSAWWRFGLTRYRTTTIAPGDDIELAAPYPRATPGPLNLGAWIAPWKTETPRGAKLLDFATRLVWLVPGLLVLMPSDHRLVLALVLGLAVLSLRRSGSFTNLRTQRSENLAIHSRLWDRMIDLPPGLLQGTARQQSATLSSGLDAALAHAELRRAPVLAALAATATALALFANPALASVLMAATLASATIAGLLAKTLASRHLAAIPASVDLHRQRGWTLGNMIELRSLGAAARFIAALRASTETNLDKTLGLKHAQMANMMATGWALILGTGIVAFAWLAGIGTPSPRNALAVLLFSVPALHAATELARLYGAVLPQKPALDAIEPVTQVDPLTPVTAAPLRLDSIALSNIGFRYPHSAPLFENLSLTIKRGEVLALSGPSGGGKSTLLRVVMGLIPPSSGSLVVNGAPLTPSLRTAYRARIATVFQDQDLGFSTIRTAVLQDTPGADLADAWSALEATGLGEVVRAMPMGIQTLLVAGAFPFSLTRQVLIARALVQNPDLLILDETLSALDAETVRSMIGAARARGAMVIYSTHRSELLGFADRIIPLGAQHQI
ncbi:ABC transporter ATP-binding protein/permease [Devosia sp. BK]|uniref:ABC transporter ATP-binding protein n=1 Tax=Devosia sp. BK TaxID=2871706 RepID=UPI00293B118A|nr:ABC transporter ATP-binding protein [Devosia sp. BK]MDV3252672.1 ABC transporter ATP-binding protein/permease [Devosia sp. BK]